MRGTKGGEKKKKGNEKKKKKKQKNTANRTDLEHEKVSKAESANNAKRLACVTETGRSGRACLYSVYSLRPL